MKRMFLCFVLGVACGAGGFWYLQQDSGKSRLEQARSGVVSQAGKVGGSIKEKFSEISAEEIKEELGRTSMVVREKARAAGQSLLGSTANARTTAAIKARLIGEPGLSAFAINVDTTDGLVTLSGRVDSAEQVARAVKVAMETEGVHKVISTLQVGPAR